jgi:hypothetical protein
MNEQEEVQEGGQEAVSEKIWWPEMGMLCTPEVKQAMLNTLDVQSRLGVEVQKTVPESSTTPTPEVSATQLIDGAFPLGLQAIKDAYYPLFPSVHMNRKSRRATFSKFRRGLIVQPNDLAAAAYSKAVVEYLKARK